MCVLLRFTLSLGFLFSLAMNSVQAQENDRAVPAASIHPVACTESQALSREAFDFEKTALAQLETFRTPCMGSCERDFDCMPGCVCAMSGQCY